MNLYYKLFLITTAVLSLSLVKVKQFVPFQEEGICSYYSVGFIDSLTANGEYFCRDEMTAAHKTLPFNSWVKVTNQENHREIYVRINDRGPYIHNRIIDLSDTAASKLDIKKHGTACVTIELVDPLTGCP